MKYFHFYCLANFIADLQDEINFSINKKNSAPLP